MEKIGGVLMGKREETDAGIKITVKPIHPLIDEIHEYRSTLRSFPQCATCWYNNIIKNDDICSKCIDIDPVYHMEPPTEYKYEDPEGESK